MGFLALEEAVARGADIPVGVVAIDVQEAYDVNRATGPLDLSTVPPFRPMFDTMWLEYRASGTPFGTLVHSYDTADGTLVKMWTPLPGRIYVSDLLLGSNGRPMTFPRDYQVRWEHNLNMGVSGGNADIPSMMLNTTNLLGDAPVREDDGDLMHYVSSIAITACMLMQCRNVSTTPTRCHRPKGAMRAKLRSFKIDYRILEIKRSRKARAAEEDTDGGTTTRLHWVRGHFKEYTPEKPLLGHHVGRWFWGAQVRGRSDKGFVVKDYTIGKQTQNG